MDNGRATFSDLRRFILWRDRLLNAEFEASNLLVFALDILVAEFPRAKFIAGIRDCYSWLDSITSLRLHLPPNEVGLTRDWERFNRLRYRADKYPSTTHDRDFKEMGLVSLEGCLAYWRWHYDTVQAVVPQERLFLFRTVDIPDRIGAFASFFGIHQEHLAGTPTHAGQRKKNAGIIQRIDRSYVEDMVDKHCRSLMDEWYPDLRASDVFG